MNLVIDASVTVAWYFDDETTPVTDAVLDRVSQTGAIVPAFWRLEVANAFQSAIRRKRITAGYRDQALAELMKMPITIDTETNAYAWTTTLQLAERFGLTTYDSAYLELAQRHSHSLSTLDARLRSAAVSLGLPLVD